MSYFSEKIYKVPELHCNDAIAYLSGTDVFGAPVPNIPIKDMHTLVIGAPGMGKTVQIRKILRQTVTEPQSVHIVFDPKGEYYYEFYREGIDSVISLFDVPDVISSKKWNLMRDIAESEPHAESAIRETVKALCKEAVEKSQNPFFPKSAEMLISAIWIMVYRKYKNADLPNNDVLIQKTKSWSRDELLAEASNEINKDVYSTINKLTNPGAGITTQNIQQELETILTQAFDPCGNFCAKGDFSAIEFIRNAEGKRLFLVYDFAYAESSRQLFGVILNLMMKEALSIEVSARNTNRRIYFYLDELPVLPDNLVYLSSLCCFGRSAGNRVLIGLQGIPQLYATYGKDAGDALIAAFNNNLILRTNDPTTVEKISQRSGRTNNVRTDFGESRANVFSHSEGSYRIPEHIISGLSTGEAVISICGNRPFYIKLDE